MFVGALQRPVNIGYVDFSEGGTLFGPYYYYLFTDLLVLVLLSYLRHIFTGGSSSSSSSSFRLSSRMSVSSHSSHSFPGFGLKEGEEQGKERKRVPGQIVFLRDSLLFNSFLFFFFFSYLFLSLFLLGSSLSLSF